MGGEGRDRHSMLKLERIYEFLFQIGASLPIFFMRIFSGILLA
jgi:hypothetical protein